MKCRQDDQRDHEDHPGDHQRAVGARVRADGAGGARASLPTALEMADRVLSSATGPDDEGSYRLIDPIGPGGVTSTVATSEVLATTLQGNKYSAWQPYRDPFEGGPAYGPPSPHAEPFGAQAQRYNRVLP